MAHQGTIGIPRTPGIGLHLLHIGKVNLTNKQSWALALFFQVRSPLILYPWIAIALALIWPISRFAHRDSPLPSGSRNIDFYLSKLNQGGALKLSAGVFNPPVNGTYAFHFRGMAQEGEVRVRLYHNENMVTSSWFDGGSERGHLGLSAVLKLATGDIVKLIQDGSGFIQDNGGYSTTFSGWLLEEDMSF